MKQDHVFYWPAHKIVQAIRDKKISCVEVMKSHLEQIEKLNPVLNSIVQLMPREECLRQAKLADMQTPSGNLHGLPMTIKDNHLVKGLISCMGSVGLRNNVAQEDSTVVSRLKEQGAIIIGMTNTPEFLSAYETDNLVYGRTNNPYDLTRTPGGSSGGCAAAVASGMSPLSIGSDAAGSIRWPAHCTGIAAHKPTIGLVPRTGYTMGNAPGLFAQFATSGPMARSVQDLILTLPIISGPDGVDPHIPPVELKKSEKPLRIAYLEDHPLMHELKGAKKIEIKCLKDTFRLLWEGFYLGSDGGQSTKNNLARWGVTTPSPLIQQYLAQAEKSRKSVTEYRDLYREIDLYRIQMAEKLKDFDILLSPVAATAAKLHGTTFQEVTDLVPCMMHSLTGWPVTVVRVGTSHDGLPIGMQVAAKPWCDYTSLACAEKIEQISGGWQAPEL